RCNGDARRQRMAHPRASGPVPRGGPEHDPEMVGSRTRSGLLHAGRAPAVPPVRPGDVPRALRPRRPDEGRPARPPRRRRRTRPRARSHQPRVRGLYRARGRGRERRPRRHRRGEARPRPPRRDDAAGRRLGDAPSHAGALRRGRDPRRHVQRQDRRPGRGAGREPGRAGLHRQAVRPAAADRQDEAARAGLNHRLEHWIVEHRVGPLNDVFVWLTRIGSWGAVWIALALLLALLRRRPQPLVLVVLADAAAEGAADLLKSAIGGRRPHLAHRLVPLPHSASCPSGHAATSFACATVLSFLAPRGAPAFYALAAAIAYSRLYVGVHWPLDVVGGVALGVLIALLLLSEVRRRSRGRLRRG